MLRKWLNSIYYDNDKITAMLWSCKISLHLDPNYQIRKEPQAFFTVFRSWLYTRAKNKRSLRQPYNIQLYRFLHTFLFPAQFLPNRWTYVCHVYMCPNKDTFTVYLWQHTPSALHVMPHLFFTHSINVVSHLFYNRKIKVQQYPGFYPSHDH